MEWVHQILPLSFFWASLVSLGAAFKCNDNCNCVMTIEVYWTQVYHLGNMQYNINI